MLEADTGSETVKPENLKNASKPTLFHKFLSYYTTYRAHYHKKRFGIIHSFRVLTVTAKNGIQVSRDPKTGARIEKTRIESIQEAARLVSGGEDPAFFLFADVDRLKNHADVLTIPWDTAAPDQNGHARPEALGRRFVRTKPLFP